jgi:iron complex transport system permease protein
MSPAERRRSARPRWRWSRPTVVLVALLLLLIAVSLLRLVVGEPIPRTEAGEIDWPLLWTYVSLRRDRLIIGLVVGAGLSVSGALLQALLRNPLASPYILGVSSGAAVGVMLSLLLGWLGVVGGTAMISGSHHAAAFVGALATMLVVYALGQRRGWIDPLGLLLVGVIVNAINGAAIMFINYMVPHGLKPQLALWMMGYFNEALPFDPRPWTAAFWTSPLTIVGLMVVAGTAVATWLGRAMDVATFSDAEAEAIGVNLRALRLGLFVLAGLMTAGTVVLAGPIGFVGLICPHAVRLMMGPAHRPLMFGSALAGALLLVAADVAIRLTDLGQGLMPIGVLTALIGGPVFLWMLRPQLGREL